MQNDTTTICKHPPARLFAWTALDEHGQAVLCVACCACGAVLKGGAELDHSKEGTMFQDPHQLFVDGGVIKINPSPIGGTWAARLLEAGQVLQESSGVITPEEARMPTVSNNLTEMLALVRGLELLPPDWRGTVFSDSQVTLGRAFMGWNWKNVPRWLYDAFGAQATRLIHWKQINFVLLDGHPTKAQLEAGLGKRGHPVSEHNVWCDAACGEEARRLLELSEKVLS